MGFKWQGMAEQLAPTTNGHEDKEENSFAPDVTSIALRLRASVAGEADDLALHEEALRQYDLAFQLLEESSADLDFTYSIFQKALRSLTVLPHVPEGIKANLELGMALCLIRQISPELPGREPRFARRIEAHLEAALAVWRVHPPKLDEGDEADEDSVADALFFLSDCKLGRIESHPRYEKAIPPLREAVQRLSAPQHRLKQANYKTILAAYLHEQAQPDWIGAVKSVLEAIAVYEAEKQEEELVWSLRQIAWIYQALPTPQPESAVTAYEEALKYLTHKSQREERADTLSRLADCLYNWMPEGDTPWPKIETVVREAVALWRQLFEEHKAVKLPKQRSGETALAWPQATQQFVCGLLDLAQLLTLCPEPKWEEAAQLYQQAQRSTPSTVPLARGLAAYQRARCLEHQPRPDWKAAIKASREAVRIFRAADSLPNLLPALQQLGYLLEQSEKAETTLAIVDERIGCHRSVVILLEEAIADSNNPASRKREWRSHLATALFNLAFILWHRSFYDQVRDELRWDEGVQASWRSVEIFADVKDKAGWADAVRLTFRSLMAHPEQASEAHLAAAHRVLRWLSVRRFPEARADLLHHLSLVLYQEPRRDWLQGLRFSLEATKLLRSRRQRLTETGASAEEISADELAEVVGQLGAIYQTQPHPDLQKAAACYRESLALLAGAEDAWRRAETFDLLAVALFCDTKACQGKKGAQVWKEIAECLEASTQIWEGFGNTESQARLVHNLPILALAHISGTPADHERASVAARRALELGASEMEARDVTRNSLLLAHSLSKKPTPDLNAALFHLGAAKAHITQALSENLPESERDEWVELQRQCQKLEGQLREPS